MNRRKRLLMIIPVLLLLIIGFFVLNLWEPEYAYMPPPKKVLNPPQKLQADEDVYDIWGETFTVKKDAQKNANFSAFSAESGAIQINEKLLKLGRETLYKETFGNEVFMTDILGMIDGPLKMTNIAKAIVKLRGKGTTNLQVELAEDITLGDKTFKKGEKIDTGIDVPKGAYAPLGMPVKYSEGKLKVGVTCMACHATVDPKTKKVIEGAPNADLNAGLLLALGTNSTAYFTHTDVDQMAKYLKKQAALISTSDGGTAPLPDIAALEKDVDANLVKWAKGNFDSTIDMKSNPTQIPDSFTKGGHPYGWSGFAAAGPFHGLSAFSNNVHAQNSDSLAQSEASQALFSLDKELYLAIILQNAANPKYRYHPESGLRPSDFFAQVDPTPGTPGVNEMIKPPSFPKLTAMAPDGLFLSSPGYNVGEQVNAMAAYQNTIVPPKHKAPDEKVMKLGQTVFERAQCITCHAGEAYTNHRIISSGKIGTDPSRAAAFKKTEKIFGPASMFTPDTPVPIPSNAEIMEVPTAHLDPNQLKLAFAWGDSPGGYKVKGLLGLRVTAPYLHDGGVAVGPELTQLGLPGTIEKGITPDPANSLRALIDHELRQQVVQANKKSKNLKDTHASGVGHEYWVDESTGFTKEEQEAFIQYLLSLK